MYALSEKGNRITFQYNSDGVGSKTFSSRTKNFVLSYGNKKTKLSSFEDKISSNGILERNTDISNCTYSFAGISNSDPHPSEAS